jgi:uroporphyrinogen-III synthase
MGGLLRRPYDWVVFSSVNAVEAVLRRLPDVRAFGPARIAAIGPGTAAALLAARLVPDLVPKRSVAEGLLEEFPAAPAGGRVLLPHAVAGRAVLPEGLASAGWEVDVVAGYQTVRVPMTDADREAAKTADAVCFASASSVTAFLNAAGGHQALPPLVVCIGPTTAAAAIAAGVTVDAVADQHTIPGLVEALVALLR